MACPPPLRGDEPGRARYHHHPPPPPTPSPPCARFLSPLLLTVSLDPQADGPGSVCGRACVWVWERGFACGRGCALECVCGCVGPCAQAPWRWRVSLRACFASLPRGTRTCTMGSWTRFGGPSGPSCSPPRRSLRDGVGCVGPRGRNGGEPWGKRTRHAGQCLSPHVRRLVRPELRQGGREKIATWLAVQGNPGARRPPVTGGLPHGAPSLSPRFRVPVCMLFCGPGLGSRRHRGLGAQGLACKGEGFRLLGLHPTRPPPPARRARRARCSFAASARCFP